MNARRNNDWRRATRRLVAGVVLGVAAILAASPPASAAVTATFTPSSGVVSVFGDSANNSIAISRNAAETILVNRGAVPFSEVRRRSPTPR
jgi:hypothetical protein